MASKYLRGNYLGLVPSTCRKPICLWLFEGLSYSSPTSGSGTRGAAAPTPPPGTESSC